jgi:transcriptional regulator with XRE-family HTH domain
MKEDDREKLATRLREAREYLGLSQEVAAKHLGIGRAAISLIESGDRKVNAIELARLAKLYQRPIGYFTDERSVAAGEPPQLDLLKRAAAKLSAKDRDEVVRFAEFLRDRAKGKQ